MDTNGPSGEPSPPRAILGNAAAGAAKTHTFLGERYRRIACRRGSKRVIVAIGRSILVIAWHLLSDPNARLRDLGPGYYAACTAPNAASATTSASSKPRAIICARARRT
jgi:transposase